MGKTDTRTDQIIPRQPINARTPNSVSANRVVTGAGWRALIGEVSGPALAHLRSATVLDLIAVNNAGVVYALDAETGVALWTSRPQLQQTVSPRSAEATCAPLF